MARKNNKPYLSSFIHFWYPFCGILGTRKIYHVTYLNWRLQLALFVCVLKVCNVCYCV